MIKLLVNINEPLINEPLNDILLNINYIYVLSMVASTPLGVFLMKCHSVACKEIPSRTFTILPIIM